MKDNLMPGSESVQLVYPLYLNIPMLTSFIAALDDGIAMSSTVKRKQGNQASTAAGGEAGLTIAPPMFASLFSTDIKGNLHTSSAIDDAEEVELIRQHTAASLFIQLRSYLEEDGTLKKISHLDDLGSLIHGDIVEITGQIFRSPATSTLDTVLGILSLGGVEPTDQTEPSKQKPMTQQERDRQQRKSGVNPVGQVTPPSTEGNNSELSSSFGLRLMKRIRDDLVNAKVIDVVMEPVSVNGLAVVISLSSEFLASGVIEALLSGHFTVLGKISRVLKVNESISLYERTISGTFLRSEPAVAAMNALRNMQTQLNMQQPAQAEIIKGPALQIIPLAIFV